MLQWCSKHCFSSWQCGAFKGAPTPRAARRCRPIPRPGTSVTRPGSVARCCRACRSVGCPPSWPWTSCASWWVHQSLHLPMSWQIRHDHPERLLCFACCRERLQTVAYKYRRLSFPALLLVGAPVFVLHPQKRSVGLRTSGAGQRCRQVIIMNAICG